MNTRLPSLVLFGALTATPAFSAHWSGVTGSPKEDAQAQAGNLLRGGVTPPSALYKASSERSRENSVIRHSAQIQAANVLSGTTPWSSAAESHSENAVDQKQSTSARLAAKDVVSESVQAQAQHVLGAGNPRTDHTRALNAVTAHH